MSNPSSTPRAAIVTFYYGENNYGCLLQGYALSQAAARLGYEPEVLCLRKSRASFQARLKGALKRHGPLRVAALLIGRIGGRARAVLNGLIRRDVARRNAALARFRERKIPHSDTVYTRTTVSNSADRYDAFLCGSDQIWNPALPDRLAYWLGFVPEGYRKIAYAPSLGGAKLTGESAARSFLQSFSAVSVRERDGCDQINALESGPPAQWVLDPTLLLTREDWDALRVTGAPLPASVTDGPYVFAYLLGGRRRHRRAAARYARRRKLKLVTLPHLLGDYRACDARFGDVRLFDVSPEQFLSLIQNADAVLTDSFHACVFAGLYHTPFYAFPREKMNSRLHSLMEIFGLEGRLLGFDGKTALPSEDAPPIDFDALDKRVAAKREESLAFLRDALTADLCEPTGETREFHAIFTPQAEPAAAAGDRCTGCRACELACPKQCVRMEHNAEGFLYPRVDEAACNQCGRCRTVCHALKAPPPADGLRTGWFGRHVDDEVRRGSSSGGAYTAIAESLPPDTLIFGAVYDMAQNKTRHVGQTLSAMAAQRKSKYVFSDLEDCYQQADQALKSGRRVLFSGTPCQIAGLYAYLGRDDEGLLTVDLICHGVPSPQIFREHLEYITNNRSVKSVDFRPKVYGWTRSALLIGFADGRHYLNDAETDPYMAAFLGDCGLRKSCYACRYSEGGHRADLTLGDFWAVNRFDPAYNDEKGLSLIAANTPKGRALIPALTARMRLTALEPDDYAYAYAPRRYSVKRRQRYFAKRQTGGYAAAAAYAASRARRQRLLRHIKQAAKVILGRG